MIIEQNNIEFRLTVWIWIHANVSIADKDGNRVFEASYDAWGRQTVSTNTIGFTRGYTGHEMLAEFGIINMGGRLYDPVLGRFFSPDNYVQAPTDSQNFNRYSYCLNNPLKYTDPTGESISIGAIIFSLYNIGSSMMNASFADKNIWKAGAISALASAASFGIGQAFKAVGGFGHELLRAGAHGLSAGVFTVLGGGNFGSGFVSGATASGIGSFAEGIKNISPGLKLLTSAVAGGMSSWASGGDFIMGAVNGLKIGLLNHAQHDEEYSTVDGKRLSDGSFLLDDIPFSVNKDIESMTINWILDEFSLTNDLIGTIGLSMKENSGNSVVMDNWKKFFYNNHNIIDFNPYNTYLKISDIGRDILKMTTRTGSVVGILGIGYGVYQDYEYYKTSGVYSTYHTARSLASWGGSAIGVRIGIAVGGLVGIEGGPLMIVTSAACGFSLGVTTSIAMEKYVDYIYDK